MAASSPAPSTATHPPSLLPPLDSDTKTEKPRPFSRRGPWRWTDYLGCYLPSYDGPYDVGTLTLELPLPEPYSTYELSSPMKRHDGRPILELNPTLTTIFYPVSKRPAEPIWRRTSRLMGGGEPRLRWITLAQIQGYLRFASITSWKRWFLVPPLLLAMGATKLPTRGAAPMCEKKDGRRKLVIFSHGLTGNRTCYSQLCGRLASQGYVVAAVEHRDGTSSHSLVTEKIGGKTVAKAVDYVDMADVSEATRPDNYLIARAFQLEVRTVEILATAKSLASLASDWKTIRQANLRVRGAPGWAGDDGTQWSDQQWAQFAAAVNWDHDVTLAGHSFGAANVVTAARHADRRAGWKRFILYDPWLETLEHCSEGFLDRLGVEKSEGSMMVAKDFPCLILNSPGFSVWEGHFKKLCQLLFLSRPHPQNQLSLFATVGGIIHSSFSDLPVLVEWLWKLTKKLTLDSQEAIRLVTDLTIEFIRQDEMGTTKDVEGGEDEVGESAGEPHGLQTFLDRHVQQTHPHPPAPSDLPHLGSLESLLPGKLLVHFKRLL